MKKKYIAIYGGILSQVEAIFVSELAHIILKRLNVVLVTGGFKSSKKHPRGNTTDRSALQGALDFLSEKNHAMQLEDFFETWLPGPEKDKEEIERFKAGKVRILKGKSAQARRFTMVKDVDAFISIKGKSHTAMALDLCLAISKPALPLPFTGGKSLQYWQENRDQIMNWFDISHDFAMELESIQLSALTEQQRGVLVDHIVNIVEKGIERRCLVLMPFDDVHKHFYENFLEPIIHNEGFKAIRLDQTIYTGDILEIFLQRLDDCDAIVVDVTEGNPNVMYELGHAHARKINPLLFSRRKLDNHVWEKLPFYLYEQKVEAGAAETEEGRKYLADRIREYLDKVRNKSEI